MPGSQILSIDVGAQIVYNLIGVVLAELHWNGELVSPMKRGLGYALHGKNRGNPRFTLDIYRTSTPP